MLIQVILIAGFIVVIVKFVANPASYQVRAWGKLVLAALVALAVVMILFPNISNTIAHAVGVSRGADLLLYALTVCFIFASVNSYLKFRQQHTLLVQIARKIALLEANEHYKHQ